MASSHFQEHQPALELDAIMLSTDPEIKRNMTQFLMEEMSLAQERALMRTAMKHSNLLPQPMRDLLYREAQALQVCHG